MDKNRDMEFYTMFDSEQKRLQQTKSGFPREKRKDEKAVTAYEVSPLFHPELSDYFENTDEIILMLRNSPYLSKLPVRK